MGVFRYSQYRNDVIGSGTLDGQEVPGLEILEIVGPVLIDVNDNGISKEDLDDAMHSIGFGFLEEIAFAGLGGNVTTSGILTIPNTIAVWGDSAGRTLEASAISVVSGLVDGVDISAHAANDSAHHARYTDAEASGVSVQIATTGIAAHAAVADAHHARYTDAEASGIAVQVATTGIQEAIFNHSAITDVHHARYTDAEASGIAVQVATTGIAAHAAVSDAHHARYTDTEVFAVMQASGNILTGVNSSDSYILVSPSTHVTFVQSSGATVILPPLPTTWQKHVVKDFTGAAAGNPITVCASGSTIDGEVGQSINLDWQSLSFIYNGTSWGII